MNGVANKSSALMELIVKHESEVTMKKVFKVLVTIVVAIYVAITSFMTLYAWIFTIGMSKHYEINGKFDGDMLADATDGFGHYCNDRKQTEETNSFKMGFH